MKRLTLLLAGLMTAVVTHLSFALPLPSSLISLYSYKGQSLLRETNYATALLPLGAHYVTQRAAYCGVASAVMVINSVRELDGERKVDQSTVFTPDVKKIVSPTQVSRVGMSMTQVEGVLHQYGIQTKHYFGNALSLAQFRNLLKYNLSQPNHYLIGLFSRHGLGEVGGGHFSPIAAYDAHSDRILLYDVASFKYPPTWVKAQMFWQAMRGSSKQHGLLVAMG